ncbi:MAG: PAS domain S-box protein [Ignavibacteria bacterium]|nr:PAS domain S-box protein [Ignavibacteria bacterium]
MEIGRILDVVDDIVAISEENGKIIYLNKKGRILSNIDENCTDLPYCYEVFNCSHLSQIPKFCPGKEFSSQRVEQIFQMLTKVGNRYFKVNCTPTFDEKNNLKYIVHIAKEETETVLKEKKLIHFNSLLKSIRNLNQYLFLERNPEKILEQACQILYQTKNYVFVGIYTSENTPFQKKIFYKSKFKIDLETDFIDENLYIILSGISEEKLSLNLKNQKKVVKYEKFSFTINGTVFFGIMLPLFFENLFFGSLLVISNYQEDFDNEEITFLREYSDDISVALYTIYIENEKEKIERASREKERFYYRLLSNLPGFVYRCRNDRYWTVEYVSENFYNITGYKPEEVIGNKILSFNDLIHKDHQERLWVKWQILLRKKQVFQDEYPIITKNGDLRWVFEQGRGIYDEEGNVVALEGYITDITERKLLEEKVTESERRYRALFEGSSDAIFIMSGDTFIDCNFSALKMFRCERSDIIGKPPYVFSPEFQPDGQSSRKKAIDIINRAYKGEELRFEWMHKTLDGTEFECEVTLNRVTYSKKTFLIAIVRDISEKKKSYYEILKLAKALDSIGEAVTITDVSNKFIYVNKAFEKLYGYTLEEIKGKTVYLLRTPESLDPSIDAEIFDTLSKNQIWRGEIWSKDKFGRKFIVQLSVNTIYDENGVPFAYVGVASDLTERIKFEQELKESEEKFRSLVSSMDDIVYTLDTEHRHTGLYGKWVQNWGLKEEDFLGKTALEILGEEDGKIHIEMQEKCLKGEIAVYEWARKLGENTFYFQTRFSPVVNEKGEIKGIVGVGRDITKLKELEMNLLKFNQIVEQTPTGVFVLEPNGTFSYINRSLEKLVGVKREELVGKTIQDIHSPFYSKEFFDSLFEKIENQYVVDYEMFSEKLMKWFQIQIYPTRDENGKLINLIGLVHDVTKEREFVQQLKDAKEKAEELNALKNYLLLNFSHEFRTPLNGIMGWAQVLMYERNEPEINQIGEIIYRSGARLLNTVDMIIDYSKIEAGLLNVQIREFELVEIVKEIVELLKDYFKEKGLKVSFASEREIIVVQLDEYMVRAITNSIVHNAFKFTREGEISISLRIINLENDKEFVEMVVSDTGIGIPAEYINLIWKEFFQVSQGLSREFEGQGLGLSIAKKFTELLGGKVFVESTLGKGSKFTILLPIRYNKNVE